MTQTLTVQSELQAPDAPASPVERQVTLARPLLGFPGSRRFALRSLGDDYAPFLAFRSLDEPGLDFIVVAPGALFTDYVFEVEDADVALLGLTTSADVDVLVLVTRAPGSVPTVNLMGPLVCNRRTGVATQVVLQDGRYGVAVPVTARSAQPGRAPQGHTGADPHKGARAS